MNVLCSTIAVALPTVGPEGISGPLATHLNTCQSCTNEVAAYGDMYVGLAELKGRHIPAPTGLTHRVLANLGPAAVPDLDDRRDHRVPVAAAAAIATAAAGTAVLVRIYRHGAA